MPLRHPLFHRTILALLLDIQESGYEPPTLENRKAFQDELIQELEEGIFPIIKKVWIEIPDSLSSLSVTPTSLFSSQCLTSGIIRDLLEL